MCTATEAIDVKVTWFLLLAHWPPCSAAKAPHSCWNTYVLLHWLDGGVVWQTTPSTTAARPAECIIYGKFVSL